VVRSAVVTSAGLAEAPAFAAQTAAAPAVSHLAVGVEFAPERRQSGGE
jgi:hypothetical protein